MSSWKAEVIADNSGRWCGNGLRFATKAEAQQYALNLARHWTMVERWRVIESDDDVSHVIADGRLCIVRSPAADSETPLK